MKKRKYLKQNERVFMIQTAIAISLGATLNRARGTGFWSTVSTGEGRWLAMAGMGLIASAFAIPDLKLMGEIFIWTTFSMYFWCVFGWDSLWSQTITGTFLNRMEGFWKLAARMSLGAPCLLGLAYLSGHLEHAWVAALTPLLAIPYFISGYVTPGANVIRNAELAVGAMWVLGYIMVLRGLL